MKIRKNITKILFLSIFSLSLIISPSGVKADNSYAPGSLLKIKGVKGAAVYQVGEDGKKYVYPDQNTYNTWHDDFSGVREVALSELDKIVDGGTVTFQPGTKLITHRNTARVYAVGEDGELVHIPDETTAREFYGNEWYKLVSDIDPGLFAVSYKIRQGDLADDNLPEGSVVQEGETGDYFLIEDGQRRKIMQEALKLRNMERKNIIRVNRLSDLYDDGDSVEEEDDIEDFNIGNGSEKIIICHKPGLVDRTIRVSVRALKAHLDHGDTRGACTSDDEDDNNDNTLPDITVSDITLEPSSPIVNATTTIRVHVKNSGNLALTDTKGILNGSNSFEDFITLPEPGALPSSIPTTSEDNPLEPGDEVYIEWTGYFSSAGEKTLTMTVDNANELEESDETNNTYTENVTVLEETITLSDITVSDIAWEPSSPVENATTTITAYIKNSGDVSLTDPTPIFDISKSLENFSITSTATSTVSSIHPLVVGESATIVWTGYFSSDGKKRLSVTTDNSDILDETDEGNNNTMEYVTVIKNVI